MLRNHGNIGKLICNDIIDLSRHSPITDKVICIILVLESIGQNRTCAGGNYILSDLTNLLEGNILRDTLRQLLYLNGD